LCFLDDVLDFENTWVGSLLDRIYPNELEIKISQASKVYQKR